MVFRVEGAAFCGIRRVEGWLHGGTFDGPYCEGEALVDNRDNGEPEEEADGLLGWRAATNATKKGARLVRCFERLLWG